LGNEEPSLDEVMVDPIVRCLMIRDGVQVSALLLLVRQTQKMLRKIGTDDEEKRRLWIAKRNAEAIASLKRGGVRRGAALPSLRTNSV
jgi:hypothetical protein